MRTAFGITRHVERRVSNQTETGRDGNLVHLTRSHYQILVTRVVIFWVTIWTHEADWT